MPYRFSSLLLSLLVSSGCANSLQRGVEAYERGDFRNAYEQLARVEPNEGAELRAAVAAGVDYSASYLLSQAWVTLERGRGAKPYREAFAYYRAALAVMPADHPRRSATLESIAELERDMDEARERHRATLLRFEQAAGERDYDGAIEILGSLVELMRSVGADQPNSGDVIALAELAMSDSEHERAVQLVELADLVRREANAHIDDRDMGEIARVAAALRYFRRIAEEADGTTVVRRPTKHKPEARKPDKPDTPDKAAAPVVDSAEAVATAEARAHLGRARQQWAAGNKFEALCIIDDAIAVVGARAGLAEQRKRWQSTRDSLIAEYVERGELALSREASAEARGWYQRILALDPENELARDRMRKLDKLQKLQSGDR